MPKVKLDPAKARGWGYFTYQVGALYRVEGDDALHLHVMRLNFADCTAHSIEAATAAAVARSNAYWAALPYFDIPLKTRPFGDRRGMGFPGYAYKQAWHPFPKPLAIYPALERVELDLHGSVRVLAESEVIAKG